MCIHACHHNLISVSWFFVIVYFLNVFHTSNLQLGGNIFFLTSTFSKCFFLLPNFIFFNKNSIKLEKYIYRHTIKCGNVILIHVFFVYSRQDHSIILNAEMQKILIHVIHKASGPKKMLNKNAQY